MSELTLQCPSCTYNSGITYTMDELESWTDEGCPLCRERLFPGDLADQLRFLLGIAYHVPSVSFEFAKDKPSQLDIPDATVIGLRLKAQH